MILVPGCGNSDLAAKIITDLGVPNLKIDAIDYEENVVQKMEENKQIGLPVSYKHGDVTNMMSTRAGQYSASIDKGTLDAIAVDDSEETVKKCRAYFNEMIRVIKNKDGVFMIVSLLQPYVLKIMLDFFINQDGMSQHQKTNLFTIKVDRINLSEGSIAEKQFLKYFVTISKQFVDPLD